MNKYGYSTEGIILSRTNYGEADRILVIYSKHFGQVRVMAKGVRKPKSRKRGHLEVFSHVSFSARSGKGMDMMTEVETINSFDGVRTDLKRTTVGYFLCEILRRLTREGEGNEKVFDDAVAFLKDLRAVTDLKSFRKDFVVKILIDLGFWSDGDILENPDNFLENITESRVSTIRVAKAILT